MTGEKAVETLDRLEQEHPDARIWLDYDNAWQLLVATILAARCTDEKVNEVTGELFGRWATPAELAEADPEEVRDLIHPTGTFRRKQEYIQNAAEVIAEEYGGEVPDDIERLSDIKGVGRKTAAIVIGSALGGQEIGVDTHVERVTRRLGLAEHKTTAAIEKDLRRAFPEDRWARATQLLTTHGRRICTAAEPDCERCPLSDLCGYYRENVAD